jgi:hypothetical protein
MTLDPLLESYGRMRTSNMRPSARQAVQAVALETSNRELRLAIRLLQEHLRARTSSDARAG